MEYQYAQLAKGTTKRKAALPEPPPLEPVSPDATLRDKVTTWVCGNEERAAFKKEVVTEGDTGEEDCEGCGKKMGYKEE